MDLEGLPKVTRPSPRNLSVQFTFVKYYSLLFSLFASCVSLAQNTVPPSSAAPEGVESIAGILSAAYRLISGDIGTKRHLDSVAMLYVPNGIVSKNVTVDGVAQREVLTLGEFHERFAARREYSFYEEEANREVRLFGGIASVWSTYEIRDERGGPVKSRGVNSFQLHYHEDRWWIVSWTWDAETAEHPIPRTFAPG